MSSHHIDPGDLLPPLGDFHRVEDYAGAALAAAWQTPQLTGPNPARHAAMVRAAAARAAVSAHRDIPAEQLGPCAGCAAIHHRYGPGGNPLCPRCLARAVADDPARATPTAAQATDDHTIWSNAA